MAQLLAPETLMVAIRTIFELLLKAALHIRGRTFELGIELCKRISPAEFVCSAGVEGVSREWSVVQWHLNVLDWRLCGNERLIRGIKCLFRSFSRAEGDLIKGTREIVFCG